MGERRKGRVAALQTLYEIDARGAQSEWATVLARHFEVAELAEEDGARDYARAICVGVVDHMADIDRRIAAASRNWRIDRMSLIDRNILRLGVYELLMQPDVPTEVVLNEAVALGKEFGSETSYRFINGILNNIAQNVRAKA